MAEEGAVKVGGWGSCPKIRVRMWFAELKSSEVEVRD